MEYQKIHAYPNDCILYRKKFKALNKCRRCGIWQYKVKDDDDDDEDYMRKGPHAKILWYLPVIPRFKHFFPMLMMQRTLHGLHMEENVMGYCDMLLIHNNGRKLIICILIWEWSKKS